MNTQTLYRLLMTTVLSVLVSLPVAFGGEPPVTDSPALPSAYPTAFQARGIVGRVGTHTLTVSGSRYTLAINATVHSLATHQASRLDLRAGTEIGFSFNRASNNTRTITEIWILPQGTIKPS